MLKKTKENEYILMGGVQYDAMIQRALMDKLIDDIFKEYNTDYWDDIEYAKDNIINIVNTETFLDIGRVHDWRNYIDDPFANRWNKLDLLTKISMYIMAKKQASNERW